MSNVILFPLHSRSNLVQSIADSLRTVHGPAANSFWRERIAGIIADLRSSGLPDAKIRQEILGLQDAVQVQLAG